MKHLILIFSLLTLLSLSAFTTTASAQSNVQVLNELIERAGYDGMCMAIDVTTIRKDPGKRAYTYTAHGTKEVYKNNSNNSLGSIEYRMAFSDRNRFQGNTDRQRFEVYKVGNRVDMKITLITWGNATVTLTNVKVFKDQYGYYITGKKTGGRSTSLYTVAMYDCEIIF